MAITSRARIADCKSSFAPETPRYQRREARGDGVSLRATARGDGVSLRATARGDGVSLRATARGDGVSPKASASQPASSSGSRCGGARGHPEPDGVAGLACRTTRFTTTAPQAPWARPCHLAPGDAAEENPGRENPGRHRSSRHRPLRGRQARAGEAPVGVPAVAGGAASEPDRNTSCRMSSSDAAPGPAGRRLRTPGAAPRPVPLPTAQTRGPIHDTDTEREIGENVVRPGFAPDLRTGALARQSLSRLSR